MELLIVDDERVIREALKDLLIAEGYTIRTAISGDDALVKFSSRRPDLVLLDVMMPKKNGYLVCEEMRRIDQKVPIIFLTAKDSDSDQVRGISLGADDFVSKSASEAVLLARISRALQRVLTIAAPTTNHTFHNVTRSISILTPTKIGRYKIDFNRRVVLNDHHKLNLTKTEFDILAQLAEHRGHVVSDAELFGTLRGNGYVGEKGTIRTHIKNLRRKLGTSGNLIGNVYNAGYYLI